LPLRLGRAGQAIPARWSANPLAYLAAFAAIHRIARDEQLDILHVQDNKFSFVGAMLAKRWLGIPLVFTVRDTLAICPIAVCLLGSATVPHDCSSRKMWSECSIEHLDRYFAQPSKGRSLRVRLASLWQYWDTRLLRRRLMAGVDGIVAISQGILEVHINGAFLPDVPTEVVYNLPPQQSFATPADVARWREELGFGNRPIVLTVGRRTPGKGLTYLLGAARQVAELCPEALFVIVGAGKDVAASSNVRALPFASPEEVRRLMHAANLVVVPSIVPEALGRVGLEAMACGKPVIGTNVGGIPEVVTHGVSGLIVPPRDDAALAAAIVALLADPARQEWMGQNGRQALEQRFNPETIGERLISFYQRLRHPQP
jgi:glycosyltransferase involved in cell wall biosynthesis